MKRIVSVKELTGLDNQPSIVSRISTSEDVCKIRILAYLKTGDIISSSEQKYIDIISGREIDHTPLCYSDGEYEWTTAEIHYVEKYNLKPDEDFLLKLGIDGKEKHRKRKRYRDEW